MKKEYSTIKKVKLGSPAAKAGLKKGDQIVNLGGYPYVDEMDLAYFETEKNVSIDILRKGKLFSVKIAKDEYEPFGLTVEDNSEIICCKNNCTFCFVRQLPKGLRKSLYVKDDDYRMSFSMGSYVTLSNTSDEDIDRIIRLHLSPLYVSVHCYTPELKEMICQNKRSAQLFDVLKKLANAGIQLHTQVVMMEGINDGDELSKTMHALAELRPSVCTLAIVPVGLTCHREGLTQINPISQECAEKTIAMVESFNSSMISQYGEPFCWCSDEMYLIAKKELPSIDYYGDLAQIENGVGLVADFFDSANNALLNGIIPHGDYSVVTGVSFAPLLQKFCAELESKFDVRIQVCPVENDFFGRTVTVTGLVTARDIINQYRNKIAHRTLIVPKTMLREFSGVFLDDVSVKSLEKELGVKVAISDGGEGFVEILGGVR